MKNLITKAKTIIVAAGQNADFDSLFAAISLAKGLRDSDKNVSLLLPDNAYTKRVLKRIELKNLKVVEKNKPDSFIVSLDKKDVEIKDVKWEEVNDKINIFVTTTRGKLAQGKLSIKPHFKLSDLIIVVGITAFSELGEFYTSNKKMFKKNKILQIGAVYKNLGLTKYGKRDHTMSDLVASFLDSIDLSIPQAVATDLLAGILWGTHGFTKTTNKEIFKTSDILMQSGANLQKASRKSQRLLSLSETNFVKEVLRNLRVTADQYAISTVPVAVSKKIDLDKFIASSWMMIDRVEKIKLAVVIVEGNDINHVYIVSNTSQVNALSFANTYQPDGNRFSSKFSTNDDIKTIEAILFAQKSIASGEPEATSFIGPRDPLKAAKKMPEPLDLGNNKDKGGYTPPPPMTPLQPAN